MSYADPFSMGFEEPGGWSSLTGRLRRVNWVAAVAAVAVNAGFFALLITSGVIVLSPPKRELSVLSIVPESKPAPPPAQARPDEPKPKTPEPPKIDIVTPVAKVQLPAENPVQVAQELPRPPAPVAPSAAAPGPAPAPSPNTGPVNVANINTNLLSGAPPAYPVVSRRKREQGIVVLRLVISEAGRVEDIAVERTSGFPALDQAAVSAVRNWRWSPTLRDGRAVSIAGLVKIPFVLRT